MKELTTEEIQAKALEILKFFVAFCEENDLSYFLYGGTLLGAIRENGFIPWDDDIDVAMPRPDYERFSELYAASQPSLIRSYESNWGFMKLVNSRDTYFSEHSCKDTENYGVFIDIFPIDGLPVGRERRYFDKVRRLQRIFNYSYVLDYKKVLNHDSPEKAIAKIIIGTLGKLIPKKIIVDRVLRLQRSIDFCRSDIVTDYFTIFGFKNHFPRRIFERFDRHNFAGLSVRVPREAKLWLEQIYGADYMTPIRTTNGLGHGVAYLRSADECN